MRVDIPVPQELADAGLPAPYVPDALRADVRALDGNLFGTREDLPGLYNLLPAAEEAAAQTCDDYVYYGTAGRGMQSNALYYALVEGPLALFLELAWKRNVYGDDDAVVAVARREWALVDQIRAEMDRHTWAPGERLVIVASDFTGTMWARLPRPLETEPFRNFPDWRSTTGSIANLGAVLEWLKSEAG